MNIIINDVDWLRNDYPVNITIAGITYPTAEHAYQAAKFKDRNIKLKIAELDPSEVKEARKIGRKSKGINPDWDSIREGVMTRILEQKFTSYVLGDRLAKTGNAELVLEGGDDFWGIGKNNLGDNILGAILEHIRSGLQFDRGIEPDEKKPQRISLYHALRDDVITEGEKDNLGAFCEQLYIEAGNFVKYLTDVDNFSRDGGGPGMPTTSDFVRQAEKVKRAIDTIDKLLWLGAKAQQEEDDDYFDNDLDYDPCG